MIVSIFVRLLPKTIIIEQVSLILPFFYLDFSGINLLNKFENNYIASVFKRAFVCSFKLLVF